MAVLITKTMSHIKCANWQRKSRGLISRGAHPLASYCSYNLITFWHEDIYIIFISIRFQSDVLMQVKSKIVQSLFDVLRSYFIKELMIPDLRL